MAFIFFINIVALIFSFFVVGVLLGVLFSKPFRQRVIAIIRRRIALVKHAANPILKPGSHPWTAEAVCNPAALLLNGRTHLVYRAVGMDGVSRLGYAGSPDGLTFDDLPSYPVYVARNPKTPLYLRRYSPVLYPSGGSWGGCEDPRMVALDGRVYVTFNMFDNWNLRVAAIWMSEANFLAKRFENWEGPLVLTPGLRAKNWMLFPERINGKIAVLHSVIGDTPDCVRIEYVDSLEELPGRKFASPDPQQVPDTKISWHVHVRSAGPPPIRTDKGWLVFYHAHSAGEGHRYKTGALLLDLNDPTKVIARAIAPVMEPDEPYENNGKPGIIYTCGAVVENGTLRIYYGGADKVACVASAPIDDFVEALLEGERVTLEPAALRAV